MKSISILLCTASMLAICAPSAEAIPLFAHKYHTTCFTCHTTPPVLNDFGRRFQANGYQLPGTNEKVSLWDQPSFAFGAVAQPMVMHSQVRDNLLDTTTDKVTTFSGIEVGLFSSASLGAHFSYYAAVPISVSDGSTSVEVETANLMYTDLLTDGTGSVNLRLGKFRFFTPFSDITTLANPGVDPSLLVGGYNPFDGKDNLKTANDLIVTDPTFGASAYGMLPQIANGLRWEAGVTGGNSSDIDLNTAKAMFFALDQTVYLNNAPVRFGGFYYSGSQDITDDLGSDSLNNPMTVSWTNHAERYGIGAEIYDPWLRRLDFFGEYMIGKDDNVDTVGVERNVSGGFVGVNVIVFPEKLYFYGRYDFLKGKETSDQQNQIDVGLQYHFLPNVFVTAVYTIKNETVPEGSITPAVDQTTTTGGIGLRFGF